MLSFFPYPFAIGIGLLGIVLLMMRRRNASSTYLFFFAIFWLYLLVVIAFTLFPMPLPRFGVGRRSVIDLLQRVNLSLFYFGKYEQLNPGFIFRREIVANILLTLPFGFGIPFVAPVKWKQIPLLACGAGIGIELAQLLLCIAVGMGYRSTDINDALMNAVGVLVGYGIFIGLANGIMAIVKRKPGPGKGLAGYVVKVASRSKAGEKKK
jgi:glycopeptide antibiotics resistance protein